MALAGLLSGRQLPATPPPPTPCGLSACLQALGVLRQSRDPAAAQAVGGAAAAGGAAGRRGQLRETRPGGPLASRCLPAACRAAAASASTNTLSQPCKCNACQGCLQA
jgi:hypothetical protein